jgi:hypothetical protein
MISAGRTDQVRVLTFTLSVARAQDISAIAISLVLLIPWSLNAILVTYNWLRRQFVALRVDLAVPLVVVPGLVWVLDFVRSGVFATTSS